MVDYGLKDRVAIITGANNPQGIGATTAFAFAREGAKYTRRNPDRLTQIKRIGMERIDILLQMQEIPMLWKADSKK